MGQKPPSREDLIAMVSRCMYSGRILNNSHRGNLVEMMVLSALGDDWKMVSLGWHPWDLQRGEGQNRIRIQVKQCAALQLWGKTKKLQINFGWKDKPPEYFERDNPGEKIEAEGRFCELFVIGLHLVADNTVDQVDPKQWEFLVIPTTDLTERNKTMVLTKALTRWNRIKWGNLRSTVEAAIYSMVVQNHITNG